MWVACRLCSISTLLWWQEKMLNCFLTVQAFPQVIRFHSCSLDPEQVTWQHVTSRWFGRYYPTICLERKWNICKQHLVAIRTVKHLHQTDYSPHFTSVQHAHTVVCSLHSSTWLTSMGAFLNIHFLMFLPSFFGPDLCSVRWKRLHLWEEENVKGRYGVMWKWLYCFLWLNWKHFKQQFILGLAR